MQPTGDQDPADEGQQGARALTRRGQRTRARLLAAAADVFSEVDYQAARIVDITKRAGASTGTFYSYFESKEAIFRLVAANALDEMLRAPRRDPDNTEGDPVRDIAYASRQYFLTCRRHAQVARSIEQLRTTDVEVHRHRREALLRAAKRTERWVQRLQEQGICDPDIDPWFTALSLQSMNVNMAYDQLVHRDETHDVEDLVAAVTPIWARAVGLDPRR